MVRPVGFRKNEETAVNNFFQEDLKIQNEIINHQAQREFDDFVKKLKDVGVNVLVFQDDDLVDTPDSVFPNNWVSFHANGDVTIYPMFAENRRKNVVKRYLSLSNNQDIKLKMLSTILQQRMKVFFLKVLVV